MKTFYDFLQNNNNVFMEQNPIVDPLVSGFLRGSEITPELEKIGNRLGVTAKDVVKKAGRGIKNAVLGQKNIPALNQGFTPESSPQLGGQIELKEIRKKYFELQNALKNYYDVINSNPSIKNSQQGARIQNMLERIENELDITYRMLYQSNQPNVLKGRIGEIQP